MSVSIVHIVSVLSIITSLVVFFTVLKVSIHWYLFLYFYIGLLDLSKQLISSQKFIYRSSIFYDYNCFDRSFTLSSISYWSSVFLVSIRRLLSRLLSIRFFRHGVLGVWVYDSSYTASSRCLFLAIQSGIFYKWIQWLIASFFFHRSE